MKNYKIKLKTPIMLNGKEASPKDENKGIYEVDRYLAHNLVFRKRAEFVKEVIKEAETNSNKIENDNNEEKSQNEEFDKLKAIADELEIKYAPEIEQNALSEILKDELEKMAEDLKLDISEYKTLPEVYEAIKEKLK